MAQRETRFGAVSVARRARPATARRWYTFAVAGLAYVTLGSVVAALLQAVLYGNVALVGLLWLATAVAGGALWALRGAEGHQQPV